MVSVAFYFSSTISNTIISSAGFDTEARRITDKRRNPTRSSESSRSGQRRNPYDFTGCLAHADITERVSDGQVTRIIGVFEHNQGCRNSVMTRIPAVPLHPHVYEVALEQLRDGAR